MKATVILFGLLALLLALLPLGHAALGVAPAALEPAWMMISGASLIALGSAVRRYLP
jgi:uncharacterized membrane protein YczE